MEGDSRIEFGKLLSAIHENTYGTGQEVDRKNLKYAIYLRKSSEESSEKQQKSLGDQLADIKKRCLDPYGITHYEIIKEEKSAKEPSVRQKFTRMIIDLRTGKFQGLIAWHPDRLARNMMEAGEIIDMLDKRTIKDLIFATAYFDNTATGKMLLGMSFVLSKQYSEHLSESVMRGYNSRIQEGAYLGKLVHGYRIMEDGRLEPDGDNFLLFQQAFQKRLAGETNTEIAKWLNRSGYQQSYGREQKRSHPVITDKRLSVEFRNTIYTGFNAYGKSKPVDLTTIYDFEPMVTIDEFKKLNAIKNWESFVARGKVLSKAIQANILRNNVICGHCSHKMYATTATSKTKAIYVYFRCDYRDCPYRQDPTNTRGAKHQLRAKEVVRYALESLQTTKFDLKTAYGEYVKDAKAAMEDQQVELVSRQRRLEAELRNLNAELQNVKAVIADPDKKDIAPYYKDDLKRLLDTDIPETERGLIEVQAQKSALKEVIVSEERFLKLMENVALYLSKLTDLQQIDEILRKFFSNFTILNKSVSVAEYTEPWKNLIVTLG